MKIVRDISKSKNLIVLTDKTSNFYEIPVSDKKILNDNITEDYEKRTDKTLKDINLELGYPNSFFKLPPLGSLKRQSPPGTFF